MQKMEAMSYYRKMAKQVHPDKNHHPMAKEAFQKLVEGLHVVGRC